MRSRLLIAALLAGLLLVVGCGGGGNDPPPVPTPPDTGTEEPLPVDPDPNETPDEFVTVNSDVFTVTPSTGIDRSVAELQFTNTTAEPVNLRLRVKSTRALQAPPGVGASSLLAWVSTMDVTTVQWALVPSDLDRQVARIDDLAGGQSASVSESAFAVVTVPPGGIYTFTSIARSFGHDGSTGDRVITTTAFTLSYTIED